MWRFVAFVLLIAAAAAALRWTPLAQLADRQWLVTALEQLGHSWWAPLVLLGLYLLLCPLGLPVTVLLLAGGVVFGPVWGSLYNVLGTFLGAASSYLVARSLGRDFVEHVFGPQLLRVERLLRKHGFWTLLRIRFLPIPFPLVNFGAALVGVRPAEFLLSSLLGMALPVTIFTGVYSSIGAALLKATAGAAEARTLTVMLLQAFLLLGILLALTFLPRLWTGLRRRHRYRQLVERRRQRAEGQPPNVRPR